MAFHVRFWSTGSLLAIAAAGSFPVHAQQAVAQAPVAGPPAPAPAPAAEEVTQGEEVVVTGYRAAVAKAISIKRNSDVQLDAISADDIASFPEANIAESLQRIPGVSIDRDNGEGRQISVRGLGGDFTRIRINNMEALSTSGTLVSALSTPNTTRSFDFNTFASELFSQAAVRKTPSAETDEGSLGATVDMNTPRPFNFSGDRLALNTAGAYYTNGKKVSPRLSGLVSTKFLDNRIGLLVSGAWQKRDTTVSNYKRGPVGQGDLLYRGMTWAGNETPPRAGFAAPTGTTFGSVITNNQVLAAQTGSNAAAYAALYPSGFSNAPTRYDDSTVIIPSLPGLAQQRLRYERIGLTGSLQFKLSDKTLLSIDGLYSKFDQTSDQYGIETVGLGRNNTNATLNTLSNTTVAAADTRRNLYANRCDFAAGSDFVVGQDCGQALYGTTRVPGYGYSFNPNNLDPFDYYTNPLSPGYVANPIGIGGLIPLIGRPSTKVLGAEVTNGVADYLALSNLDWRSQAIRVQLNTMFKQLSANLDHEFSDTLSVKLQGGWSKSTSFYDSQQVEFNALDRPETYVYDARDGGKMPTFTPGFDVSNPTNWGIVKSLSVMRHNVNYTDNVFKQGRADFKWKANDEFTVLFGGSYKRFDFSARAFARNQDAVNPTEKEAKVSVESLGQTIKFGDGLKLAEGTPDRFFVPNIDAFTNVFGFNCDCINKFGDFRLTSLRSNVVGNNYDIVEEDKAAYFQANFKTMLFDQPLSGNFGLRYVHTGIDALGRSTNGRNIADSNGYSDYLPALNLSYEALPDLFIRFGASAAMSRPPLQNLSPSVSAISIPTAVGAIDGASLSVGNTRLDPYRSNNTDLAMEYYFRPNSVFSIAVFNKSIGSYPQLVTYNAPLSNFLTADAIAALRAGLTDVNQRAYLDAGYGFAVRQFRNAPGGYVRGIEANLQTDFWFLPGILSNFGIQLNATKIKSSLDYILDPGVVSSTGVVTTRPVFGKGPFLNASPEAVNFTFYYQDKKFSARTSLAWRSDFYTQYPIQSGACQPGSAPGASITTQPCASPLMNDFVGARGGMNVDAVVTYDVTDFLSLRLEGLNLTNRPDERFAYIANPQVTNYASSGTQITFGARMKF